MSGCLDRRVPAFIIMALLTLSFLSDSSPSMALRVSMTVHGLVFGSSGSRMSGDFFLVPVAGFSLYEDGGLETC